MAILDSSIVPGKTVLGSYILVRPIAQGGSASVWEGWLNPYVELGESMVQGKFQHLRRLAGVKAAGEKLDDPDIRKIREWIHKRTAEFLESPDTEKLFAEGYAEMLEYVAAHRRIAREFRRAIKVLNAHLAMNPKVVQRFLKEIDIQASTLDHPCIAKVVESGQAAGKYFAVMEYVEGIDLEETRLSIPDAVRVIRQALEGLIHAHEKGILHRDIKPGNILVSRDFKKVKLTDFGLAKAIDEGVGGKLTSTGIIMGTPNYLDPERARGEPAVRESDVFSLGATFYKLLTGRPPAQATSPLETMGLIGQEKDLSWPRGFAPEVSEPLEDVVMMMLSKIPRWRLTTSEARELLGRLEKEGHFLHRSPTDEELRARAARAEEIRRKIRKLRRAAGRRGRPERFAAACELYDAYVALNEVQPRDDAASVSARLDAYGEAVAFHSATFVGPDAAVPEEVAKRVRMLEKRLALERRRIEQKHFTYQPRRPRRKAPRRALVAALLVALGVGGYFGVGEIRRLRYETAYREAREAYSQLERRLARREYARAAQEIPLVQRELDRVGSAPTPEYELQVRALRNRLDADRKAINRYQMDIQVYAGLMDAFRRMEEEHARMKAELASGRPPGRKAVEELDEQVARLLGRLRDPNMVRPDAIGPELAESLRTVEQVAQSLAALRARARDD